MSELSFPVSNPTTFRAKASVPILCVGGIYLHHASRSGYGRLVEYIGTPWRPSRTATWLGNAVLRIPGRLVSWYSGLYEYSRPDFVQELSILPALVGSRNVIFHFLYAEKQFLLSAWAPRRKGVHLVGTFHHHPQKFPNMVQRWRHYRRLDLAIAVSTVQLEMLEAIVGHGKVHFVPHGIDTDYWMPDSNGAEDGVKRLVFGGCHMRDFAVLAAVIDNILKLRNDVEFVLVSPEKASGTLYCRRNVRWLYRIPDDQYLREMQRATLLVLPLKYSTAVNTVLEALACGAPVVTTRGGISDYLDESCSVQTPPGDATAMTRAILDLLDAPKDLARMREAARRRSMEFAWPQVANKLLEVFALLS